MSTDSHDSPNPKYSYFGDDKQGLSTLKPNFVYSELKKEMNMSYKEGILSKRKDSEESDFVRLKTTKVQIYQNEIDKFIETASPTRKSAMKFSTRGSYQKIEIND